MRKKEELLRSLSDCVKDMEDEQVVAVAEEYITTGYPALDGILHGLVDGMQKAAALYEAEEYFIPELLLCSDAMYNGLAVLRPHIQQTTQEVKHKIVIGVVEGDIHDIGKNLVRIMLESAGYEMFDLGRDVPLRDFVNKAKEVNADIIALSTLMSTTMPGMAKVIDMLKTEGIRNNVKVIIGGGPIAPAFAKKIGADGYSSNALDAVKLADRLMGKEAAAKEA
ncbi:cobalamin-binding protein [Candidatus Formimonas warabiya]|uniref:Cobalamin-binding protein n=2 Tax=Formimonas warabiya TaxID=1761012 RepID=A0A3G1KW42_FORW1|nr:corrinoid protein [Candidatus Formimonas warabiya]ATW26708.1 cobalamin-binding protein [Candidatus Formimonas warabiya]